MIKDLSFEKYCYFPTLRTRHAELKGLGELDAARKSRILPLLTLGKWPQATDFLRAADKVKEAMGDLPYFLDLTADGRHLVDHLKALRDPSGYFSQWRAFVSAYPYAIPVVQLPSDARSRDIIRQAVEIERSVGKVAFRIRDFAKDTPLVVSALSAMDDARNALVFIDCGYIRAAIAAYVAATITTINQLRAEFPEAFITALSTSFPSSTKPFADSSQLRGSINILERDLHERIGGHSVAAYGDHGSVHSVVYDDAPIMRWAARIDYPREFDWYFERRPKDQSAEGYISAAKEIVKVDPDIGSRKIWGEQMIVDAANGIPHAKAPASWIAVRVNIHLARQLELSESLSQGDSNDTDDDDF
ncbi:MAG: beta family protein [Aquabacterium sp.]|uniref:beta family protein n=1 Tax=Aquabacterium sp. TaxID=1872578 RepID=UPI0027202A29|nr:beta family protein [Aquabacterium sp.]MDO9006453.1 beta family protein [Aquabacterium sp.]